MLLIFFKLISSNILYIILKKWYNKFYPYLYLFLQSQLALRINQFRHNFHEKFTQTGSNLNISSIW